MAVPVVLDTDLGDDIDDTWALAMLLKSPEVDLRFCLAAYGDTEYRARLLARFLQHAGRSDIPVGVGVREAENGADGRQYPWVADYALETYPGTVHEDGVDALIRLLMTSTEPVTLLSIGPLPNVAEALRREPAIAPRTRFVGMHGSVYVGYGGASEPSAEWNVKANVEAARAVFTAPWREMVITPLDTCGLVALGGADYARVRKHGDAVTKALLENHRIWQERGGQADAGDPPRTKILYDTVAAHLTYSTDWLEMKPLHLAVTEAGMTVPVDRDGGGAVQVAVSWRDQAAFEADLARRLCDSVTPAGA